MKLNLAKKISLFTFLFFIVYVLFTSIIFGYEFKQYVINGHINNFYPYFLILSIILFIFGGIVTYRSKKFEFSSLILLNISIYSFALSYLMGFLNWDPTGGDYTITTYFQLQVIFSTIGTVLIYIHSELNNREVPQVKMLAVIISLFVPHTILNIYHIITGNYGEALKNFSLFTQILLLIGTIVIFGKLLLDGIRVSENLLNQSVRLRNLGSFQLAGVFILFYSIIGEVIETLGILSIRNTPLFILALIFIVIPYYFEPKVFWLISVKIKLMTIIDENGLAIYFNPVDKSFEDTEPQLFAGLTMAFANLGEDLAKTTSVVDSLNFGDRSLIVEVLRPYYFIIIAENSTYFLLKEMKEYLIELKSIHPDFDGVMFDPKVFDDLNKKFFPIMIAS